MNRIDSGFAESYVLHNSKSNIVQRSNTTSSRSHRIQDQYSGSISTTQPVEMDTRRPASERRTKPSRQKSTTSSDNSATRSKRPGHNSKPSSRRTSCTIVDPSRPARHYRVKSTHSGTAATGQDIDDVLALHFRSCSLFSNPSYQTNPGLPSPTVSHGDKSSLSGVQSRFNSMDIALADQPHVIQRSEETITVPDYSSTTMHWNSPSTRQRDYDRIDRANNGIRGLMRKIMPRCISGPPERFYEKDKSDAGSVRRYRMDDVADHLDEKDTSRLHGSIKQKRTPTPTKKKSWACF